MSNVEAYAVPNANLITGLAASAFTWSSGYTSHRDRLNDGVQDEQAASASTAQASGQYLQIDLGAAHDVRGIALLNHNLAVGACSVEVRISGDPTFATYDVGRATTVVNDTAPYDKDCWLTCFVGVGDRYVRIIFTHTGTKIVRIGEMILVEDGNLGLLSRKTVYGAGESERYVTNRVESTTGNVRATLLSGPIRTKQLPYADLRGTSERDELMTMWRLTYGGVHNLLFLDAYNELASDVTDLTGQQCLWGKLQESLGWTEGDFRLFGIDGLKLVGLGRGVS